MNKKTPYGGEQDYVCSYRHGDKQRGFCAVRGAILNLPRKELTGEKRLNSVPRFQRATSIADFLGKVNF